MSTDKINVLLLGSGGRESAIACKLSQSPLLGNLFIAPGNGGTDRWGTNVALSSLDFEGIARFAADNNIDLVFAGNEDPLVAGLRERLAELAPGLRVFGPGADGARLEGSKDFAKGFMQRHGIPTAASRSFTAETVAEGCQFLASMQAPYVLKADGLAAGKGVVILTDLAEAQDELRRMLGGKFGKAGDTVVIEQFLSGVECSVFVLTDGTGNYRILPVAKDYKRIGEGDTGLNTGGMGAVSPVPFANEEWMAKVDERIVRPTLQGLTAEGIDYRGVIFLGLINVDGNPMVIEYNVRFGDPETEVVLMRLDADLLQLAMAAAEGNLGTIAAPHTAQAAATVMAVSAGYPEDYAKGFAITGNLMPEGSTVFHAGTAVKDGQLVTSGGRVLAVSSMGNTVPEALAASYAALDNIHYQGKNLRRDIGRDIY